MFTPILLPAPPGVPLHDYPPTATPDPRPLVPSAANFHPYGDDAADNIASGDTDAHLARRVGLLSVRNDFGWAQHTLFGPGSVLTRPDGSEVMAEPGTPVTHFYDLPISVLQDGHYRPSARATGRYPCQSSDQRHVAREMAQLSAHGLASAGVEELPPAGVRSMVTEVLARDEDGPSVSLLHPPPLPSEVVVRPWGLNWPPFDLPPDREAICAHTPVWAKEALPAPLPPAASGRHLAATLNCGGATWLPGASADAAPAVGVTQLTLRDFAGAQLPSASLAKCFPHLRELQVFNAATLLSLNDVAVHVPGLRTLVLGFCPRLRDVGPTQAPYLPEPTTGVPKVRLASVLACPNFGHAHDLLLAAAAPVLPNA